VSGKRLIHRTHRAGAAAGRPGVPSRPKTRLAGPWRSVLFGLAVGVLAWTLGTLAFDAVGGANASRTVTAITLAALLALVIFTGRLRR
jgi:hypothetical protein